MSPSVAEKNSIHREPLKKTGALDQFKSFEVTPYCGTEFPEIQVTDLLKADNADELIRDLAITGESSCDLRLENSN